MGEIAGIGIVELEHHADVRGSLTETFRQAWFPDTASMVQSNISRSAAGVLRGMHFHRRQADYWCVIEGRAFVALVDLRTGSPTEREVQILEMDPSSSMRGLRIPPGVAHGFAAVTDVLLMYLVDQEFDETDEHGFAWNDPDVGIPWPLADPVVSARDAAAPPLARALGDTPIVG